MSRVAKASLIDTGTPSSGGKGSPWARRRSASLAASRAPSRLSVISALSSGLKQSMRVWQASTSASAE